MSSEASVTIGHLIDAGEGTIQTGPFGTQFKAAEYRAEGIPMINVKNIGFGSVKTGEIERVGSETRDRLKAHVVRSGDIVFGRKGAVERHAFIREDQDGWVQGSDCIRLRMNTERFLPRYVSYAFLTPAHRQWMMNQCSHGATMASLNQDILRRIELRPVSIQKQTRIVSVLQAQDELIENNLRRIEILEEMAQAIYREWFVNFRFPGNHNPVIPEPGSESLPEAWRRLNLFEVAEVRYGFGYKSKGFNNGPSGRRVVRIRDIPKNTSSTYTDEDPGEDYEVGDGDILVGMDGEFHMCIWHNGEATLNQRVARFRPKLGAPIFWLFHSLKRPIGHFNSTITGTTVAHLGDRHLKTVKLEVPPEAVMTLAHEHLDPLENLIGNLLKQNRSLKATRDLLLPKLISGEIDVSALDINTTWLAT